MNRVLIEQAVKDRTDIVVLYYLPDNVDTPYVTWLANKLFPEQTFYGHYFSTLEEAQEDFEKRSFGGEQFSRLYDILDALRVSSRERDKMYDEFRGF